MSHPFDQLTPDLVLDAVESLGYLSDARVLALNSYENRVYQVGIEDGEPLIAKFYRPDRWSDAAIREEHAFSAELAETLCALLSGERLASLGLKKGQKVIASFDPAQVLLGTPL